jgi:hypothetical protein
MAARRKRRFPWADLPLKRLLEIRLCDLGLTLENTWVAPLVEQVRGELADRDLLIRPHFWLSDEWFSPGGVPGVAIPFYLVHPRLLRVERSVMLQVEGGTRGQCLAILRHELGHAVQHAYQLHRSRPWQRHFGLSSTPYPDSYRPNPASREYVLHLDAWYAQSHPDEDFAETFAVWLTPRSNWPRRYRGWPALKKLEFVDELMTDLAGVPPAVRTRRRVDPLPQLRSTLLTYYRAKRERYSPGFTDMYDKDLLRLFSSSPRHRNQPTAASFLRRHRQDIREIVAKWTGEYRFTLDQVLKQMIGRCRELRLRAVGSERQLKLDFAILLTMHTTTYLYRGREWHTL